MCKQRQAFVRMVMVTAAVAAAPSPSSGQVKVIISGGFSAAYHDIIPEFERETGIKVTTTSGASQGKGPDTIGARLRKGVAADVVIMSREGLRELIAERRIVTGTDVDLAQTPIGVAVRAGTPKPDIGTVDAFEKTLLRAKAVAIPSSTTGIYLTAEVFPRLTGGPHFYSTWLRSGSSWRGAGEDGLWSVAGTSASQVWQPPHVLESVNRDGGADRYATATRLQNSPARPPLPLPDTVYIASGTDYPDALSGGPAAARARGSPAADRPHLAACHGDRGPELTQDTPQEIVILGGTGAVSAGVESALGAYAPTVRRVSGADRYQTAVAASRDRFPDGLGGPVRRRLRRLLRRRPGRRASAAGHWGGPLLLTSPTALPAATAAE